MASTSSTSSSTGTGSVNFSTGLASGIDWSAVTDALIKADSYPLTKLQNDVSNYTTQKNVFNALSSSLQTFESKLKAIKDSTSFGGKTTSISDLPSGSVTPFTATIGSGASSGDVKIRVEKLAAAQRVRSNGVSDAYAPLVADGQISIKSGTNDAITIDVSSANGNNSLQAIADTINAADKGVAASIVSDGTNQLLVVKSTATGAANALTISDTTNLGLADSANNLQDAADAVVWVDGIRVTSATNSVSGALAGVTLNLSATTDAEVTLHVADDVAGTKQSLQDLVDAYNSVNDLFQSQLGSSTALANSTVGGNAVFRSIQTQLQQMLTTGVSGIADGQISTLAELGIQVADNTGKLEFKTSQFDNIVSQGRYDEVQAVLRSSGSTTDNFATYIYGGSSVKAGTYGINVTQAARQATASATMAAPLAADETLSVALNGGTAVNVSLASGDTADAVVSKINAALKTAGVSALASNSNGTLSIASNAYGSAQSLTVSSSLDGTGTGFSAAGATATGADVKGTIGGFAAHGSGRDLIGDDGTDVAGLTVRIYATDSMVTQKSGNFGTVGFSAGAVDQFVAQIDGITDPLTGTIHATTTNLDEQIKEANDQIATVQARLDSKRELLTKQFSAAEQAVSQLNQLLASLNAKTSSS